MFGHSFEGSQNSDAIDSIAVAPVAVKSRVNVQLTYIPVWWHPLLDQWDQVTQDSGGIHSCAHGRWKRLAEGVLLSPRVNESHAVAPDLQDAWVGGETNLLAGVDGVPGEKKAI